MSQVGAALRGRPGSRSPRFRTLRSVALVSGGVLAVSLLTGCSSGTSDGGVPLAAPDLVPAVRDKVADGGTVRWAVDAMPTTLNAFQADADGATSRVAGAVLPSLYTLDGRGRPALNPDYLESAQIVEREPKQVVLYKLNQQAVWSDGREIGAPDFVAQWRALNGRDTAYWTARNAGYERIEKIEKGASDLEVRVTFGKPYADWQSLFSPLYPKDVMGSPAAFNEGARGALKATAGPFRLKALDRKTGAITLDRNPHWWGQPAKLDALVLAAVPRDQRAAALTKGSVDLAEIDRPVADRITLAVREEGAAGPPTAHGPGAAMTPSAALKSWALAYGSDEEQAELVRAARQKNQEAIAVYAAEQDALRRYRVRKSLEPAYTQLSLNGESGPLADERVRRAVARALDRRELAEIVLSPLGLPAKPPGSHLALAGQAAYADSSNALGEQNAQEARALLADAGWVPGGANKKPGGTKAGAGSERQDASEKKAAEKKAGEKKESEKKASEKNTGGDAASDEGLYIVGDDKPGEIPPGTVLPGGRVPAEGAAPRPPAAGQDGKAEPHGTESGTHVLAPAPGAATQGVAVLEQAAALGSASSLTGDQDAVAGAYAPRGTAAPAPAGGAAEGGPLGKDGKPLTLRFVLPSGPGSESLRQVGDKIVQMLDAVGIRTEITKVADDSFFKDHVAAGDYDLALYSWPASAFPATDARPIFAKPEPASDGSLLVEQNYSRVGTDRIDQLFDQAVSELDEEEARALVKQADARIWAAAGSIPLYQRPQLVAARHELVNAGAFGFAAPRYQDIGWKKTESSKGARN
ncbi:ABC transporter family substrate-binding protein [Streptomyces sp.]|uniref:ABC transporter family substrate-binding protein n=1 Tax=Streptomyces sp. TaxID=1931 RepID=UPI002F927449